MRRAQLLREDDLTPELARGWATARARAQPHAPDLTAGEIQLVRYAPGGFFYLHQDAVDSPAERRQRSFILYLNDDFGGGATSFPDLSLTVQPRTGYALAFPPHRPHQADAVTRGEKFVFVFWFGPSAE